MKHKLLLSILSLLTCFLMSCKSDPVDTTGNISGTIYDSYQEGVPLQGVNVTITGLNLSTTTGTDGHFYFSGVEQGTYEVQASKTNYVTDSKKVTVRVGQTSTLDFSLNRANSSLSVSPLLLDFGSTDTNLSFDIQNTGKALLEWHISEDTEWLVCTPTSGTIQTGMKASVVVTIDRSTLAKGTYNNTIIVTSKDGGSQTVRFNVAVAVAGASLPQVSMLGVDGVTDVAATFSGSLVRIGTSRVTAHGFCWSSQHNPSLEQGFHQDLGATDSPQQVYTFSASTLEPNTTYYVRAFASNAEGTVYSSREERFTTDVSAGRPRVETGTVSQLTSSGAVVAGNLIELGHESGVTQYGHVWSSQNNEPTIDGPKTELGSRSETGSFVSTLSGLNPGTLYYVRAYARNVYGVNYGNVIQFTTAVGEIKVTTSDVSSITYNEATCGGRILELQGNTIRECGICWDIQSNPTLANNHVASDSNSEDFSLKMTELHEQTNYHVRAYVIAVTGETFYGQDVEFKTMAEVKLPQASATIVSEVGLNTAKLSASVTSDGGGKLSACGFCYSTTANPTISDSHVSCDLSSINFSAVLSGLKENTHYYVRAYVCNERGTNYGEQVEFQTTYEITLPILSALSVTNVTSKKATFVSSVTSLGNGTLRRAGFCYSPTPNPTISDVVLNCGKVTSLNATTSSLEPQTTYYVRAFAENEKGVAYSEEEIFVTKERKGDTKIDLDDYSDDTSWDAQ